MPSRHFLLLAVLLAMAPQSRGDGRPVVGLDRYYHHEMRNGKPYHYAWEDTEASGYSELQKLIEGLGAVTTSLTQPASKKTLSDLDIYMLVTPGTPEGAPPPNYLDASAIDAIVAWVQAGGVLMLLNNDKDHAEFTHTNRLAQRFGITFNGDVRFGLKADPRKLQMHTFPAHPFFQGVSKLHMRSVSTLTVKPPAEVVYRYEGDAIMAVSSYGKGTVFALGDPWGYNEYIDYFDNRTALKNVFGWLLTRAKHAKQ